MNRGRLILVLGILAGVAAFAGFYYLGTSSCRQMMSASQPELLWLKKEFNLGDAEFRQVVQLHEAYLPQCAKRCQLIEEQTRKLGELLRKSAAMTPEIQEVLLERARIRAGCETEMLRHFLEVSRTMPPEQGRRYLAWVEQQTFLNRQGMEQRHHLGNKGHSMQMGGDSHH